MKEGLFYKKINKNTIQCELCPRLCKLQDKKIGFCHVRQNIKGKLYSMVYGKAVAVHIDPIEKKPLFHFYPGSNVFSFGTVGCNLRCKHCQNWEISQIEGGEYPGQDLSPEKIIDLCIDNNCKSIAATYNEPTIFYEYMLDAFKLAKKNNIKTTAVSNGFVCKEPMKKLLKYLDAVNVDLKGFTNKFYGKTTTAWLEPVLDTLKLINKSDTWLEITNLMIPTLNDDPETVEKMVKWIKDNLGKEVPVHFTAFYPYYELNHLPPTSEKTLEKAHEIAKKHGLKYVYVGNIRTDDKENTYCPKCNEILIERVGFNILQNNIKKGKCDCGRKISGKFN
ncbi:AmmeMemoRadiSam system radical SAM enzyme [Candidatus Woesearchaeota archaeon]|nr:AmmeMemoRadiSam system radical SAM enzyme [Candidatus Woesearchaeota archaeon]